MTSIKTALLITTVTWVAPRLPGMPELAWMRELDGLSEIPNVHVNSVTGDTLTRNRVATALTIKADIVIISGHGEPGAILLPGDEHGYEKIQSHWMTEIIRNGAQPDIVILGACGSNLKDEDLHSLVDALCRGGVNAIGFPAEANDIQLGKFAIEFVRIRAGGSHLLKAFDAAQEVISRDLARRVFFGPGVHDDYPQRDALLFNIDSRLARIEGYLQIPQPRGKTQQPTASRENLGSIDTLSRGKVKTPINRLHVLSAIRNEDE